MKTCGHFGQRGQSPCWQWGQSPCGHSFLTQRGRRVYVAVRSFYRRCFNSFQMSELEIDLELFAVHFALTGSGDSPRVVPVRPKFPLAAKPNEHSNCSPFQRRAVGTVPLWSRRAVMGSGDSPSVGIFRRHTGRIFQWAENRSVPAENNMSERGSDGRSSHGRFACDGPRHLHP